MLSSKAWLQRQPPSRLGVVSGLLAPLHGAGVLFPGAGADECQLGNSGVGAQTLVLQALTMRFSAINEGYKWVASPCMAILARADASNLGRAWPGRLCLQAVHRVVKAELTMVRQCPLASVVPGACGGNIGDTGFDV